MNVDILLNTTVQDVYVQNNHIPACRTASQIKTRRHLTCSQNEVRHHPARFYGHGSFHGSTHR